MLGGISVSSDVPGYLLAPISGVHCGSIAVLWTTVPKASVYEDRHLRSRKYDVYRSPAIFGYGYLNAIPETSTMKLAAESDLWLGVPSSKFAHSLRDGEGAGDYQAFPPGRAGSATGR